MEYVQFMHLSVSMMIGPAFCPTVFSERSHREVGSELNQGRLKKYVWNTKTDIKTRTAQRTHRRERLSKSILKTHYFWGENNEKNSINTHLNLDINTLQTSSQSIHAIKIY